ncbi:MAG: signal recognition particle-docking protein FtsY [Flavobacteriales bacterium]|nr:signal recognition particle-docking protein FtsY [Flavobacteriales bacterium]
MGIFNKIKGLFNKDKHKGLVDKKQKNPKKKDSTLKDEALVTEEPILSDYPVVEEVPVVEEEVPVVEEEVPVVEEEVSAVEEEVPVVEEEVPVVEEEVSTVEEEVPAVENRREKLDIGLKKTKDSFFGKLAKTIAGKSRIDTSILDDIEEALITSDIGVETSLKIIEKLEDRVEKEKYINSSEVYDFLKEEISLLMHPSQKNDFSNKKPYVIMIVGVNGVGKTTTIGKLAYQLKKQGKKVMLGAADTFRAAAIDQLVVWAKRIGVDIVKQEIGSDPASVCYDTLQSAKANNVDVVIIDTAGRLHNKINLMNELTKIKKVMSKIVPDSPHDVMLILDASTGQNAIEQAKQFTNATNVSSISLTKLDGTAKGGVIIGISNQFKIPVRYIGIGEGIEDLQEFKKKDFIDSLFS